MQHSVYKAITLHLSSEWLGNDLLKGSAGPSDNLFFTRVQSIVSDREKDPTHFDFGMKRHKGFVIDNVRVLITCFYVLWDLEQGPKSHMKSGRVSIQSPSVTSALAHKFCSPPKICLTRCHLPVWVWENNIFSNRLVRLLVAIQHTPDGVRPKQTDQ